ncbi:MAG: arginine--tRNA ligase [Nitrospinota bacterium]
MKNIIYKKINKACRQAIDEGKFPPMDIPENFLVEIPKEEKHGDFSTNIAMILAPLLKKNPREVGKIIIDMLGQGDKEISKIELAGPGFINFFMEDAFWHSCLKDVIRQGDNYGRLALGRDKKVQVEFVSANPTGPLHIGHGRGAAVGDVVANILDWAGYDVTREYYINDAGEQMRTLGLSTLVRYKQLLGKEIELPEKCYQGDYIKNIAQEIIDKKGETLLTVSDEENLPFFTKYTADTILDIIKDDLKGFGVEFDTWYSENTLFEDPDGEKSPVEKVVDWMREKNFVYESEGALWLRAAAFGDDKDRVVRKGTGAYTYLASDIAYHKEKFERGFERIVNVWGADHHGYVSRLRSAIKAMKLPDEALDVILIQLVNLKKGDEMISMSTRSGQFLPLTDLIKDVGSDAARFFFLMRSSDAQFDFDVDLAKKQSSDNPVYYIQYAHARICSIFRQAEERMGEKPSPQTANLPLLKLPEELRLIKKISEFPGLVERMAVRLEPHLVPHYLNEIASELHSYYKKHRVLGEDKAITNARLALLGGIRLTIKNSLKILGVSAPESM